jgi:ankyrin repeat protein
MQIFFLNRHMGNSLLIPEKSSEETATLLWNAVMDQNAMLLEAVLTRHTPELFDAITTASWSYEDEFNRTENGTLLHMAVLSTQSPVCCELIVKHADINPSLALDANNRTPLSYAIELRNFDLTKRLLEAAQLFPPPPQLIFEAIRARSHAITYYLAALMGKHLLDNTFDQEGNNALILAAKLADGYAVQSFLATNVDVNAQGLRDRQTALHAIMKRLATDSEMAMGTRDTLQKLFQLLRQSHKASYEILDAEGKDVWSYATDNDQLTELMFRFK